MKTLARKTAVITGAASGIGRATACALAESGCHVALVDIDTEGLNTTRRNIETSFGDAARPMCYEVDVGDAGAVEELARRVVDDFGAVHIVINNAGINVTGRFEDHSLDDFQHTFDVNLWGVIHGCRAFLPHLRTVDDAHIVNISSVFGFVGVAGQAAYSASKFAVRGLTETLHEELADTHIGVSVVHPGCIDTNIIHTATIYEPGLADTARDYFRRHGCAPEVVADRIVAAIEGDRHRVLVTPEARLLDWLRRLFPTTGNRIANRLMNRLIGWEE